jgi:hypothetical protein
MVEVRNERVVGAAKPTTLHVIQLSKKPMWGGGMQRRGSMGGKEGGEKEGMKMRGSAGRGLGRVKR